MYILKYKSQNINNWGFDPSNDEDDYSSNPDVLLATLDTNLVLISLTRHINICMYFTLFHSFIV